MRVTLFLSSLLIGNFAVAVPLIYSDGSTHVISGPADSVIVYNDSTVTMLSTANINGDVVLGRDPSPAPAGTASSATLVSRGGTVSGDLTSSLVPIVGDPPLATDLNVTLAGSTEIKGNVTLGANNFDATFADNVKVHGDVVLERAGANNLSNDLRVSGGTFGGVFVTLATAYGWDRATITGGHFQSFLGLNDVDDILITDGVFDGLVTMQNAPNLVTITGGQFSGGAFIRSVVIDIFDGFFTDLNVDGSNYLSIYGGTFDGNISGYLFGDVNIYGGLFTEYSQWLFGPVLGSINVYGNGLTWDGSMLSGYLSDGNFLRVLLSGTFNLNLIDVPVASVPEPATILLFGAGLFGMGLLRRRRSFC